MIYQGDLRAVLPSLAADSIDACVTDPPYELGFMGRKWDKSGIAYDVATWREVLRVLRPGAHLLAFGGTRTSHRMVCAIEDAGFEIRDAICYLFGSGYPKSLDVSKAIDKTVGATREREKPQRRINPSNAIHNSGFGKDNFAPQVRDAITLDAQQWSGWGSALKPAHESICLARKPLIGTIAENVLTHGTGGLHIDATRIGTELVGGSGASFGQSWANGSGLSKDYHPNPTVGRWPANVLLDEEAAKLLDAQSGTLTSGANPTRRGSDKFRDVYGAFEGQEMCESARGVDSGGASRFFYTAKPSKTERDDGLYDLDPTTAAEITGRKEGSAGLQNPRAGVTSTRRNTHATVKPIDLMQYLVRLITPPNGLALDPFAGSGTTGIACRLEDRRFIGIEKEAEHVEIAWRRISEVNALFYGEEEVIR